MQPNTGLTWDSTSWNPNDIIARLRNTQVRPQPQQPTPGCGNAMQVGLLCLGYCQCEADAGTKYRQRGELQGTGQIVHRHSLKQVVSGDGLPDRVM